MNELQNTLNGDKSRFEVVIGELRFWITQRRCQKTLQHLPVSVYDKLPLMYPPDSPMSRLGKHKFFLRLHKHPNSWIVVEFKVCRPYLFRQFDTNCYVTYRKRLKTLTTFATW